MAIKKILKQGLKFVFGKRPIQLTAQITQLGPSELLKDRVALITGGTSGIGYAIADAMLRAGTAAVVITGRDEERCRNAVNSLLAASSDRQGKVLYQVLDNRKVGTFDANFSEIQNKLSLLGGGGGKKLEISILVNNAGTQGSQFGSTKEEDYDNVMDTNLKGVFFLSQLVARYMVDNHIEGNILNIASASSLRPAASVYTLTKVGIKEFTLGMAKSLIPHGIVVNGLAPGPTATPMLVKEEKPNLALGHNPLGRFAMPEEIANMAVILTSNMSRTVVGSIVYMTGGGGTITYEDVHYPF